MPTVTAESPRRTANADSPVDALKARLAALDRDRSRTAEFLASNAADREHTIEAIKEAYAPRVAAIAEEAHALATGWARDRDAALASAQAHADGLAEAMAVLHTLPTFDDYGRTYLADWKARLRAVREEAGIPLDMPTLPDPISISTAAYGRVVDTVRPLTDEHRRPHVVWTR